MKAFFLANKAADECLTTTSFGSFDAASAVPCSYGTIGDEGQASNAVTKACCVAH